MFIRVDIPMQRLIAYGSDGSELMNVSVSTATKGAGEVMDSNRTPRGWHKIRAKIGSGAPVNSVFVGRRSTNEIYSLEMRQLHPDRDWILTRILWLSGLEPGFNRLGNVDTMRRFIYIHGCPDDDPIGVEGSAGCIKMRNLDIVHLYDLVELGTLVFISDGIKDE